MYTTISNLIGILFDTHMYVHETYYTSGWKKGLIKAQYIQIRQWDNIPHWDKLLGAAETLLALGDEEKKSVYESVTDNLYSVVGAIEDPHDITLTVNQNSSIIQIAVRYQYSWL